jgi:uncharacterized protein YktB (UPF0637 family)
MRGWAKIVTKLGIVAYITVIKIIKRHVKTQFTITWTPIVVKEVGDRFHQKFQIGLWIDPCRYMRTNFGFSNKLGNQHELNNK